MYYIPGLLSSCFWDIQEASSVRLPNLYVQWEGFHQDMPACVRAYFVCSIRRILSWIILNILFLFFHRKQQTADGLLKTNWLIEVIVFRSTAFWLDWVWTCRRCCIPHPSPFSAPSICLMDPYYDPIGALDCSSGLRVTPERYYSRRAMRLAQSALAYQFNSYFTNSIRRPPSPPFLQRYAFFDG